MTEDRKQEPSKLAPRREPVPVAKTVTALHQAEEEGGPCVHCGLPWDDWTKEVMKCPKHVYGVNTRRPQE